MLFIDTNIGIYRFYNKVNGKSYVGQSRDLHSRRTEHLTLLRRGADGCVLLQRAWNKYGEERFGYEVVCNCKPDELSEMEIKYIKYFDSYNNGYNCVLGGPGCSGYHHTEDAKRRIGIASKGIKRSEETKKRMSAWQLGKKLTPEHRQKLSDAWTDERKRKFSESRSGELNPNYGRHGANACYQVAVRCQTGEWFYTLRDAADWCGQKTTANISSCIHGRRDKAGKHPETGKPLTWERVQ